jgi:hypothetical protein
MWCFYTIPAPGDFGSDTWPAGSDIWKYGGGSVWQTPALDPDLGLLYITVGNPAPDLRGSQGAGDNLFTESIVALDARSGTRKWHFQEVHHDIWDYDVVSPNILFDVQMNGTTVRGLGQAGNDWLGVSPRPHYRQVTGRGRRASGAADRRAEHGRDAALSNRRLLRSAGMSE